MLCWLTVIQEMLTYISFHKENVCCTGVLCSSAAKMKLEYRHDVSANPILYADGLPFMEIPF